MALRLYKCMSMARAAAGKHNEEADTRKNPHLSCEPQSEYGWRWSRNRHQRRSGRWRWWQRWQRWWKGRWWHVRKWRTRRRRRRPVNDRGLDCRCGIVDDRLANGSAQCSLCAVLQRRDGSFGYRLVTNDNCRGHLHTCGGDRKNNTARSDVEKAGEAQPEDVLCCVVKGHHRPC